jgi:DNA-binding CsgD family transcriptional regulator
MRDSVSARTVHWLCSVVDLMREPMAAMPVRPLLGLLAETFDHTAVSSNWTEYDGTFGMIMEPAEALLAEQGTLEQWLSGELLDCHALMAWYALTRDPLPYTTSRVPTAVVPKRRRILVERPLIRLEMEHQLSILYRLDGIMQYAYVVARGKRDFNDDDLEVARYVQRSTSSLDAQCAALRRLTTSAGSLDAGSDLGLTGRELAVLQLVADGHPTRVIGRLLGCEARTVEKHLERIFRKLGVRDRLNAIRVTQLAGVLGQGGHPRDHPRAPLSPGEFRGPVAASTLLAT